jgi:hypothetical protein
VQLVKHHASNPVTDQEYVCVGPAILQAQQHVLPDQTVPICCEAIDDDAGARSWPPKSCQKPSGLKVSGVNGTRTATPANP